MTEKTGSTGLLRRVLPKEVDGIKNVKDKQEVEVDANYFAYVLIQILFDAGLINNATYTKILAEKEKHYG